MDFDAGPMNRQPQFPRRGTNVYKDRNKMTRFGPLFLGLSLSPTVTTYGSSSFLQVVPARRGADDARLPRKSTLVARVKADTWVRPVGPRSLRPRTCSAATPRAKDSDSAYPSLRKAEISSFLTEPHKVSCWLEPMRMSATGYRRCTVISTYALS